jgi:hypothetical protein
MPAKDGVGSDERRHVDERTPTEGLAEHGQPSALFIGQPEALSAELLLEDAVLFPEIIYGRILLARDPPGHGGHEDLPGLEDRCHPRIVAKPDADRQLSTSAWAE